MTAWDLKLQQSAQIKGFNSSHGEIHQRLVDLGFKQEEKILCLKIPPFNGPKVFQNANGVFSIEREIAQVIEVEV